MKIIDFLFPIYELDSERVTSQIKNTYKDLSAKPLSLERRAKVLLLGIIVFLLFGGLSYIALRQSGVHAHFRLIYMAPFAVLMCLFLCTVFGPGSIKTLGIAVIFPQIAICASIGGFLLIFGAAQIQTFHFVVVFYCLIVINFLLIIAFYRSDFRKFPEIAYKNSQQKRSKWWLIILTAHPIGIKAAQTIPYGVLGVGMLMFAFCLCHFESFLIIIARFQPQVAKIAQEKRL